MKPGTLLGLAAACLSVCGSADAEQIVWRFDNLDAVGGHAITVEGEPKVIDTPAGKAIEFDGVDDGLFLDVHPLAGMTTFTVEVVFRPYRSGAAEQRFFHMQEDPSQERVMFETRLVGEDQWFLDTFIYSGEQKIPLYAEEHKHSIDAWYHAAIVVDEASFRHYVNGELELAEPIRFESQASGRTSIGVRLNRIDWFKGAIRTARFTPRALAPEDFLTARD